MGFTVVVVATIADGVDVCDVGCGGDCVAAGVGDRRNFAPCVVSIFRHNRAAAVHESKDVALLVQQIVERCPGAPAVVASPDAVGLSFRGVQELQYSGSVLFKEQLTVFVYVDVCGAVDDLGSSQTVGIIRVSQTGFPVGSIGELREPTIFII